MGSNPLVKGKRVVIVSGKVNGACPLQILIAFCNPGAAVVLDPTVVLGETVVTVSEVGAGIKSQRVTPEKVSSGSDGGVKLTVRVTTRLEGLTIPEQVKPVTLLAGTPEPGGNPPVFPPPVNAPDPPITTGIL